MSAFVRLRRYWPEDLLVRAPSGADYRVVIHAVGFQRREPYLGQLWAAIAIGFPLHLIARRLGRGWRVEVVDVATRRSQLRRLRPSVDTTVIATVQSDTEARRIATDLAAAIQAGGEWQLLAQPGRPD